MVLTAITGGTYFTIAWGVICAALVAWLWRAPNANADSARRRRIYAILIVGSFFVGAAVGGLFIALDPQGPSAPGASGWDVGHVKWFPLVAATVVAVMLFLVEIVQWALGGHVGHPHTGCEAQDCRGFVRRYPLVTGVAAVLVFGGLLAGGSCLFGYGCLYDFVYLPALEADPMAIYEPPGADLCARAYSDRGFNPQAGGQVLVSWIYEISDPEVSEAVLAAARSEAAVEGWTFAGDRGCKKLGPGVAFLEMSVAEPGLDFGGVAVPLIVEMGYAPRYVTSCD